MRLASRGEATVKNASSWVPNYETSGATTSPGFEPPLRGRAALLHYLAVLARVNGLAVLPTTFLLFGLSGERTWGRLITMASMVFVLVNANFLFLDRFYHYFWSPISGLGRKGALAALAVPALMMLGFVAAVLGLGVLSAIGVAIPSRWPPIILVSVAFSVVYGVAFFRLEDSRKNRRETRLRLALAQAKQQDLEEQRTAAEIRALQALIQPHFVFNTLNSIAALIHDQPARAEATTLGLARLMRHILEIRERTMTTLESEVACIRAYLEIEQIRAGDRLRFEITIPDSMLTHSMPVMLLQPLVENAVKHGARQRQVDGCVWVTARESEGGWKVEVIDNGPGFSTAVGTGNGMSLTQDRLLRIYGDAAYVRLERNDTTGETVATLKIPTAAERVPVAPVSGVPTAPGAETATPQDTHVVVS